jgi:hypothetical protein
MIGEIVRARPESDRGGSLAVPGGHGRLEGMSDLSSRADDLLHRAVQLKEHL